MNWFQAISSAGAFFVTRIKNNAQIEFLGRHREPNKKLGVLRDEIMPPNWNLPVQEELFSQLLL
ncbi:MAG: hypothetical protein IKB25_02485 [Lentisphaeria bacterium]|nr:hypothetical protein [Lentisphaeria bacterium]